MFSQTVRLRLSGFWLLVYFMIIVIITQVLELFWSILKKHFNFYKKTLHLSNLFALFERIEFVT